MFSPNELKNIEKGMGHLKNKITLKIFTDYITLEDGTKSRKCMLCDGTLDLLDKLAKFSNEKLVIEEISTEDNAELANKYKIDKIPTILFLDDNDKVMIRYMANPTGPELAPFIETLGYYSGARSYYMDLVQGAMSKIEKSNIKLFITLSCPYCPSVVPLLNLIAITSKGKINVEIVDTNMNPELAAKYNIQGVPHTLINEKDTISGMVTLQDIIEKLTKGKRDFGGMYA